jgi:MFS family permease
VSTPVLARCARIGRRLVRILNAPLDVLSPSVRRIVEIEITAAVLLSAFNTLVGPFGGLILRRNLHATPFQLAIMASAGAALMLPSPLWVRRMDGHPPLPYVVWPGFIARGLFLLVPFIHSAWPFVGILVAGSLLNTISQPAYTTVIEAVYPREERGRALGVIRMTASMLPIGLAPLAGKLIDSAGYMIVFSIAGVLGMASALWQRRMGNPPPARISRVDPEDVLTLRSIVKTDRTFRTLLLASSLFGLGVWIQGPVNPLMWVDVLHADALQVGIASAAASIVALVGNAYWGRLMDRQSSLGTVRVVYAIGMLTPIVYLAGFVFRTPWILILSMANDAVASIGLDIVVMMALMDIAGPARGAQYQAVYLALAGVRGVIGPLLGATAIQYAGIPVAYAMAAVTMLGGVWVAASLSRQPARVRPV